MNVDKVSIIKDITDRQSIIEGYKRTGYLDRDKAIDLIYRKRVEDPEMLSATLQVQAVSRTVPLEMAPDEGLIQDLLLQIAVLSKELQE